MEALEKITSAIGKKLEGRKPSLDRDDNLWDAAVLLPLVNTQQGVSVLFEVRAAKLGWQPGDVCFPGGRAECSDESFEATAVRETCEELGLESSSIKIAGGLNYLVTHMGQLFTLMWAILSTADSLILTKTKLTKFLPCRLIFC